MEPGRFVLGPHHMNAPPNNSLQYYAEGGHTVAEIRVHVVREIPSTPASLMNRPDACAQFFMDVVTKADWFDPDKECTVVVLLDRKNRIRGWNLVSLGSLTAALMHPREVFRPAIAAAASAVIVMHQHPSGDPAPSAPDMHVTRLLREAAKTVDIQLLDHVIVGRTPDDPIGRGYFSFREGGLL